MIINDDIRWIFRKVDQGDYYGIDGFADVVSENGEVTGQSFALQVKYGDSYFSNEDEISIPYYGRMKHFNFYCNVPNPVLIIVGRPGSPLYWQMFEIGETEKTPSGWKLDIPKRNILDASARNALLRIVGSPTDAAREAVEHWEFTENLAATAVILYYIDPSDIISNNIDNISSFIDRITKTSSAARKSQGKLELFTSAFDQDRREIWEIPSMKKWIAATEAASIPWFFLCNTQEPSFWLKGYFASMCDGRRRGTSKRPDGTKIVHLDMNPKKMGRLLEINFHRLNQICDRLGFSDIQNKEISYAAMHAIGMPYEAFASNDL